MFFPVSRTVLENIVLCAYGGFVKARMRRLTDDDKLNLGTTVGYWLGAAVAASSIRVGLVLTTRGWPDLEMRTKLQEEAC
ncbi:unnamed protein product [Cylicocyclus nassatus]|uniref:Uncharacterized protein n=1 Tax=Cylicocyclus nassatus TaxID=53992 RepID=A0AA36H966_CYLNA|nr:unnamed protein product [Cylicocyclus nassatus]